MDKVTEALMELDVITRYFRLTEDFFDSYDEDDSPTMETIVLAHQMGRTRDQADCALIKLRGSLNELFLDELNNDR